MLAATAEYVAPLRDKEVYLGGDASYRSSFVAAVNLDPFSTVPAYTLFGAHVGLRRGDGRWDASLWVRNLFNTNYYNTLAVSATYGIVQGALGEPRLFGVTLRGKL